MRYLIDTDWVIHHLRGVDSFTSRLNDLAPEGLALSVVTLAELYEGVYFSQEPARSESVLNQFLAPDLIILTIDQETSRIFARERGRMRLQGSRIADMDLFIAATCLRHDLVLLSNNRRHFELVEELEIISI